MFVSCTPREIEAVPTMDVAGEAIGCHDIAERFEQGAVTYSRDFERLMEKNRWSHPRFVKLLRKQPQAGSLGYTAVRSQALEKDNLKVQALALLLPLFICLTPSTSGNAASRPRIHLIGQAKKNSSKMGSHTRRRRPCCQHRLAFRGFLWLADSTR